MADFHKIGTLSISCPKGFLPWLKEEVVQLGYNPLHTRDTGLDLKGSLNDAIRLNFWLRTAHRVHFLIDETESAGNPELLYEWISGLPWEEYIPDDGYLSVTSRISHPSVENTQFANLKVKDAVVDRIRQMTGTRPDSGSELNRTVLFLYWDRNIARIYLDTSGESLSRRGYRTDSVEAPLQESLAAVMLLASRWKQDQHLINPMCGSGTIAIEAALMALNRPPASLRHQFGFMHLKGYSPEFYQSLREAAKKESGRQTAGKIIATDRNPGAVETARKNARTAGVEHLIQFQTAPFEKTSVPEGDGIVIFNPPYGERLDIAGDLGGLYRGIGDFLKNRCNGKTGYVLTGNFKLAKKIGLRSNRRIPLYNSTIECRLLEYELYKGSR